MELSTLLISTALKIGFVLAIIFSFAPILIWAERRQSAMIQDRIGPVRADLKIPAHLLPYATGVVAAVAFAAAVGMGIAWVGHDGLLEWWLSISLGGEVRPLLLDAEVQREVARVAAGEASAPWLFDMLFVYGPAAGLVAALLLLPAAVRVEQGDGRITLFGLLHPIADALKFLFKEDFIPPRADRFLHAVAPILTVVTAIATFAVIPFADTLFVDHSQNVLANPAGHGWCVWDPSLGGCPPGIDLGTAIPMQVASVNVGILFIFAIAGTGVVGAAIAGYSSDNKYSLLGGLRAAGQMVSYEVSLGLTIVPMFMIYGTLLIEDMVRWQAENVWGILVQPFAFVLFFTSSIAETKRIPFDVPEGESELVGGYFTEYSGMKFGMFFMGEFIEVIVLAGVAASLFFGGYDIPFLDVSNPHWELFGYLVYIPHWAVVALQMATFVVKLALLIWLQLMIRWTLPRMRYDQLMSLCWKYILPASLVSIMLTGIAVLLFAS